MTAAYGLGLRRVHNAGHVAAVSGICVDEHIGLGLSERCDTSGGPCLLWLDVRAMWHAPFKGVLVVVSIKSYTFVSVTTNAIPVPHNIKAVAQEHEHLQVSDAKLEHRTALCHKRQAHHLPRSHEVHVNNRPCAVRHARLVNCKGAPCVLVVHDKVHKCAHFSRGIQGQWYAGNQV
ncbi:hypothetical protein ORF082R [Spotted knifejaw iridovirus]|nr:hypothetical protein ORF082R [Spotted knifejaw iridovirus]